MVELNRHGDLARTLTRTGELADSRVWDPYGQPAAGAAAQTGRTDPTVGFQADWTDPLSGEVWMGARWYAPADGVFTSRDSYAGELSTPVSLNRYTYAHNDPLEYFDPDGHAVEAGGGSSKSPNNSKSLLYRRGKPPRKSGTAPPAGGAAVRDPPTP